MLVMSKGGLSADQAADYYKESYTRDDYYTEKQQIIGQWSGKGSTTLGLEGEVTQKAFQSVLNGLDPRTGEVLVPGATHHTKDKDGKIIPGTHRAGWDAVFNAPKSISLQALVGGDERLLAAHRQAVKKALTELETYVQSRVEGGSRNEPTGNMVAASFEHIAARPSRSGKEQGIGPDPHLHTHVVISNMTRRQDEKWRAVQPVELYRSQAFITALYRAELARKVQELGYDITLTGEKDQGKWELAGYSREHIEAFSHRGQDIKQQLKEQGLSSSAAAQVAAHNTRLPKGKQTEAEMKQEWQERAQGLGLDLQTMKIEAIVREPQDRGPAYTYSQHHAAYNAVTYAREHLTERDAVMHVRTLEMTALQRGMGTIGIEGVRSKIALQTEQELFRPITQGPWKGQGYTTQEMLKLEDDTIHLWGASQEQAERLAEAPDVAAWAQEKGLSAEQSQALTKTLTLRDWLSAIEGKAGAAKTTTVGAMVELLERRGRTVYGFGPTTGSVDALQKARVDAQTVASLLAQKNIQIDGKWSVWIVDESSLLATRTVNALLHRAREAQVARVIFVGDQRQHGAIEAGRPIAQLQEAGMETARLDTIRRQRDPKLLEAVKAVAKGNMLEAVDMLVDQQRVNEIADKEQRYAAIAQEYARGVDQGQPTLVVSPANAERTALNSAIRNALQEKGHLPKEGINHNVLVNRSLTRAQLEVAQYYQVGDIIKYGKSSKKLGIEAGEYARVEAVDTSWNWLTVQTADKLVITYSPGKLKGVNVYREEPRELAVGERIQFRAPLKEYKIASGTFATITNLNPVTTTVALRPDSGTTFTVGLNELRHIEHGYAVTSHSSQGATVDKVLVNIDTEQSVNLVNRQQFYVSLSRARHDAQIFTNKREDLAQAVSRSISKTTALEAVPAVKVEAPEQKQSMGMRMRR